MKKIIYCLLVTCFTLSFFSFQASAASNEKPSSPATTKTENVNTVEVKGLLRNAESLNKVSKSTLAANKMASTPAASARHRRHDGGVLYISGGTILLIIILVILL